MILYDLGIKLYEYAVKIASYRNINAKKMCEGHKNIFTRLKAAIGGDTYIVWFHAASLGEFEQGRPVIEAYRKRYPNDKVLVTFFSPSGYEIRKDYQGADYVFYLPFDTSSNVKQFLDIVNPKKIFFIKYEFWINYLTEIHSRKIECYLFSAIFNPKQLFFKPYGGIYRKVLNSFTHIFVQDKDSLDLLASIGVSNVTVAGDTRFDRVSEIVRNGKELPLIKTFKAAQRVFIVGSSWEPDDKIVTDIIFQNKENIKFIIAPHQITEQKISTLAETLSAAGHPTARYTKCTPEEATSAEVLLIDIIGILSSTYKYAELGMIGGGFGVGIHNTLEAATFGLPLMFGNNYHRFKEACDLIDLGAATSIESSTEAIEWFNSMITSKELLAKCSLAAAGYVKRKTGATDIILNRIQ